MLFWWWWWMLCVLQIVVLFLVVIETMNKFIRTFKNVRTFHSSRRNLWYENRKKTSPQSKRRTHFEFAASPLFFDESVCLFTNRQQNNNNNNSVFLAEFLKRRWKRVLFNCYYRTNNNHHPNEKVCRMKYLYHNYLDVRIGRVSRCYL